MEASRLNRPRVGLIGPMLGSNPGWAVGQGEVLAGLLAREGWDVRTASSRVNRWLRLADVATSPWRWRGRVDVLILMVFSGPAFRLVEAASSTAFRLGMPMILWLHGGNLADFASRHPDRVRRVLARGRIAVAPSKFLAEPFGARVIPNVVDLDQYLYRHRPQVAPRLLWMRTFHELYRPDLALRVLERLPGATLTMAGQDKGLLAETRRRAEEMGLDVRFPGFLDAEGKRREFAAHDVFLNTNRVDNAPVSVLEAAAFGLPVVSTDVGGIPCLLRDGEEALLVPEGDSEALTEAMARAVRRLLDEPGLAGRLSAAGREVAERSSWDRVRPLW
ncbi:MAG TPA: glycosyltransferase family 4 protein, partial [Thermoanaerobaculia bacterium]|nr:glycosyltransferase family 4 protein [Thermoanaerobaculia bacterium]